MSTKVLDADQWITSVIARSNQGRGSLRYRWSAAYMAALFESDEERMQTRILDAERTLAKREHELSTFPKNVHERQAVIAALHALSALRFCLGSRPSLRVEER